MIKTLIFDLGNVVLSNDWHYDCPKKFIEYEQYFDISYDQMEKGWNSAWPSFQIGKITEDEFWYLFLTKAGAKSININKAKTLWRKYQFATPGMSDLLDQLVRKYTLAVCSNTGKEWLEFKRKQFHLDDYFSHYVSSASAHIPKPDKKIFELTLEQVQVPAASCVFIDDSKKIVDSVRAMGMIGICFEETQQLKKQLRMLKLL